MLPHGTTPRVCSVPGCGKPHDAHDYCKRHHYRWARYGNPLASRPPRLTRPPSERFWSKVDKNGPLWNGVPCWLWTAATNGDGYGKFGGGGTAREQMGAHRWSYEALIGPILPGLELDHLCHNRLCVNPSHLEPVTTQENIRRGQGGQHQAIKTHCPKGHPYDLLNTDFRNGRRSCRACRLRPYRQPQHTN